MLRQLAHNRPHRGSRARPGGLLYVVSGSGITNSMLANALEGASLDAVVAAGAAGVEVEVVAVG